MKTMAKLRAIKRHHRRPSGAVALTDRRDIGAGRSGALVANAKRGVGLVRAGRQPTGSPRCSTAEDGARAEKYQTGITRPFRALKRDHPGFLTCRNTGVGLCPRGDTLHTHTAAPLMIATGSGL